MAVLEGGLLFRSTFALAGAHRWSIPTPGARRSEHQRGVLCCCALSIIRRFLVEDSEQVQVSHSLARDDRLEVHVGKGKEVALRASRREEESTAADNWEEREGGGTGRRTSFQEHVRVGRCPPMVDPHAGGSAQRASEGRALLLRLIDHTAVPGRRLGASAGVALPRPRR